MEAERENYLCIYHLLYEFPNLAIHDNKNSSLALFKVSRT